MTDHANGVPRPDGPQLERLDPLWSRVVEGHESDREWRAFVAVADEAPALWRELAWTQRESRQLGRAVAGRIDHAGQDALAHALDEAGALRLVEPVDRPARGARAAAPAPSRWRPSAGAGLGWALAACIAGAWVLSVGLGGIAGRPTASLAGGAVGPSGPADGAVAVAPEAPAGIARAAFLNPDEALRAYLEMGQKSGAVVGELPGKPVLEKRALENGDGFEVIFVRQIIERSRVPAMYEFGQSNEFGGVVPTPVRSTPGGGSA